MGMLFGQISDGAIFDAKVMASPQRVSFLKSRNLAFPQPIRVRALIDTGASTSCIDASIVQSLGLDPSGSILVHTPSTMGLAVPKLVYDASVLIGEGKLDPRAYTVDVVETELLSQGFQLLVGRDILSRCILNYEGPNGRFSLAY